MEKTELEKRIIELWHISRTALAANAIVSRYDRMIYIKFELNRTYPDTIVGMSPKKVWFKIEDTLT